MEYRRLGSSDLTVSEIALGSWLTFGGGIGRDRAKACVDRAFELGINFIDTANVYGRGAAEEFLGEALSSRRRDSFVLATKLYFPMSDVDRGLSRAQVLKQVDASLGRLRTDYVDLYQCHRYDTGTPLEETMEALTEIVRAGKARHLGFSEWTVGQITAAQRLPGLERFVSSQPQYSLLWRLPERAVMPLCEAEGISQLALAWVLRRSNVASAIVGASRPEQLDDNAAAAGVRLDSSTLAAIDDAVAGVVVDPA